MEETEHALYNRVRAAEMQRRKQEQDVQRLFGDLESLTKENDKRMKVFLISWGMLQLDVGEILWRGPDPKDTPIGYAPVQGRLGIWTLSGKQMTCD